jgi:hypothetical protein
MDTAHTNYLLNCAKLFIIRQIDEVHFMAAKLEYLMVYTQAGLPIYSKCFGNFCKTAFKNPELLTGFLSALETMPLTISSDMKLDSVRMGKTDMRFSKSVPTGHSIVVGMSEDDQKLADKVFKEISGILESDLFREVDWTVITAELMNAFEEDLMNSTLPKAVHEFKDECPFGDQCPLHVNAFVSRRQRIWGAIKRSISSFREKMKKKMSGN